MIQFIARGSKKYTEISPGTIYESSVQELVYKNLDALFPEYFGVLADPFFETPAGNVKPDLVLVRHDLKGWALVEVEVEGHSWSQHILPQLAKLAKASAYDADLKKLLGLFSKTHGPQELEKAFEIPPIVYLAIHGETRDAREKVKRLGVEVLNINVFHCPPNDYILSASLDFPTYEIPRESLIKHSNKILGNLWILKWGEAASLVDFSGTILVDFNGKVGYWQTSIAKDGVLMKQPSDLAVDQGLSVVSVRIQPDSKLLIVRTGN